jgi:hypothetical protein
MKKLVERGRVVCIAGGGENISHFLDMQRDCKAAVLLFNIGGGLGIGFLPWYPFVGKLLRRRGG